MIAIPESCRRCRRSIRRPTRPSRCRSITAWSVRLRNYFLTGLVLVGPAYITISLTWWFINWVDDLVRPFIPIAYRPETYLPVKIPGTGLIIALTALTLLGFLTANFVGRKLVEARREHPQPHAGGAADLQEPEADLRDAVLPNGGSSFRRVGLVEFPSPGMWSLVFLSNPASAEIAARLPDTEHVAAFMPCTPNPTTGFFFYVPRRDVVDLDITVEAAMTLLMSAGMVQPGGADQQKKLAASPRLLARAGGAVEPHRRARRSDPSPPRISLIASSRSNR